MINEISMINEKDKLENFSFVQGGFHEDPIRPIDIELGSMDFASYQMLCDATNTMIADQDLEENFRQDFN